MKRVSLSICNSAKSRGRSAALRSVTQAGTSQASLTAVQSIVPEISGAAPESASLTVTSRRSFGSDAQHFTPTTGSYLDPDMVRERIFEVVKSFKNVNAEKVSPAAHFINDLGLDSLDTVEIMMALEEEFKIEIPDTESEKLHTISDAIKYISSHPHAK